MKVRNIVVAACAALASVTVPTLGGPKTLALYEDAIALTPSPKQGAKLFSRHCASCHGREGGGSGEKVIPALAGQVESYLLKQLIDFVNLDRDAPEMHRLFARKELARPQAWRDLAAHLSGLAPNELAQVGEGTAIMRGANQYGAYCASCHGKAGEGMSDGFVPALRSQHYAYLLLQLRQFDAERRLNLHPALLEHMVDLSREDMEAMADYLSRMLPSTKAPAGSAQGARPDDEVL